LRYINAQCAQWQHDAIGIWPGKGEKAAADLLENTAPSEALAIVASTGTQAPAAWFVNPTLTEPTPLTITDDGQVYGHIATLGRLPHRLRGSLRVTTPLDHVLRLLPHRGQVALDDGTRTPVGNITIGGGHAGPRLGLRAAMAHYDSTSSVAADVTASNVPGKGIWVCGRVRPGATDEQVTALMASKVSGDWRDDRGRLTLCAVLSVNVAGFPVPRVAAANGVQQSLVAAGVVMPEERKDEPAIDVSALARAVTIELAAMQTRRDKIAAVAARFNGG
jgi:hypothetical protein